MANNPIFPGDTVTLRATVTDPDDSDNGATPSSGVKHYLMNPAGTVIDASGVAGVEGATGVYDYNYLVPDAATSVGTWTLVSVSDDSAKNSDDVTFYVRAKIIRTYA